MIEVKHLTKRYGNHTAVSDLSFTIEKGVIYGFLGPNGAGKSTTMNIITGCLGATAGGTTLAFRLRDGVWETAGEPSWPVNQEAVQGLADQLVGLQATRKLEDVKNAADYGLEEAVITVTASWKSGAETTYSMGDATPFEDGYYLKLSGQDGTVYTISSSLSDLFSKTQGDLTAMEEIPDVPDAAGLKIGGTLDLVKADRSKTVDPDQLWYDADTDEPVDGEQAEALAKAAAAIAWDELVTANADAESLESWQLNEEKAVSITLKGKEGAERTLLLGAEKDESHVYARLPGSSMVYTVRYDDVKSLLGATKEGLWIKAVLPMPYDTLSLAEFVTGKGTYRIEKTAAPESQAADAEAAPDETAASSEGAEDSSDAEKAQKELWAMVTALKASSREEGAAPGEQVLSVHAVNADGKESTVVFMEHSADYYLAQTDDAGMLTVSADEVDAMIRFIRTLR